MLVEWLPSEATTLMVRGSSSHNMVVARNSESAEIYMDRRSFSRRFCQYFFLNFKINLSVRYHGLKFE
jgi:hypothetical protein